MLVRQTCTGSQIFFSEFQHISIYIPASLDIERHAFCHVKGSAFAYYLYRTYIRSQKKTITRFFLFFVFFMDLSFVSHWCLVSPQNIKRLLLYFWCCFFFSSKQPNCFAQGCECLDVTYTCASTSLKINDKMYFALNGVSDW